MPPRAKQPAPRVSAQRSSDTNTIILSVGIIIAIAFFMVQARSLWFTQDDAYISYRYAQNALDGHGLVFNAGERVEGYTNFLWVIWLIFCGVLGFDFDPAAKALGLASAAGIIILAALLARSACDKIIGRDGHWGGIAAAFIVAVNASLAYWAVSGLETALFGFLITLSIWLWLRESHLTPVALALATMTRPEGGLVWLVLVGCDLVLGRNPRRALILFAFTALLLAPFGIFKLLYYGSLLPNPFHAKTGLAWEYVESGFSYTWLFLQHYALWGLMLIPIGVAVWKLPARWRAIPILFAIFTIYIIVVGGDVLRPHRFFMPLVPLFAAAIVAGMAWVSSDVRNRGPARAAAGVSIAVLLVMSIVRPREMLKSTRELELGLIVKMTTIADYLRRVDDHPFTLAVSTIGKVGFDLPGRRIIDMLGLTDSTVARHPEEIPGNVSSWRERNFNASYVLSQNPDWILFSTGHKPSAPAERALILHSQFRQNYHTVVFPTPQRMLAIHKSKGEWTGVDTVWHDIKLAQDLNAAYNDLMREDLDAALAKMHELKRTGPGDYSGADGFLANIWLQKNQYDSAMHYANAALAIDSFTLVGWQVRGSIGKVQGDTALLEDSNRRIRLLCPWMRL